MTLSTLIVEDDEGLRSALESSFRSKGHEVSGVSTVAAATDILHQRKIDLTLLDIRLPDGSGLEFLTQIRDFDEAIIVVMMTAFPEVKSAVQSMKEGAYDFIVKPFELQELHLTIQRAIEARELRRSVRHFQRERRLRDDIAEILGESDVIEQVREQIRKVAVADTPVLITGETGSGKELVVESIHRLSSRSDAPLVKVNCSAISEHLLESELFGHEKGAFTDAKTAREGLFEMADGGSLFLDEVSEMRTPLQAKLLRIVEGHPFRRIGGKREIRTNVRVIASSNRDLPGLVKSEAFREDLYFRLSAFPILLPPLRARGSDIVLLARFFLKRSATALRRCPVRLTRQVEEVLQAYAWPGNVRELRNMMERAVILCETGTVTLEHLPGGLQVSAFVRRHSKEGTGSMPSLSDLEREYVAHVLQSVDGNLSEAARILGIARNTLKAKLAGV